MMVSFGAAKVAKQKVLFEPIALRQSPIIFGPVVLGPGEARFFFFLKAIAVVVHGSSAGVSGRG